MEEQENNSSPNTNEKVGDYLRRIREARGLKLEQLAKSIRLGLNILQAIEENNWGFFPTEAYLRSYIASMCEKLSVDKNIVLKKFSAETDSQFAVEQMNVFDEENPEDNPSSGGISKIVVIIILAIIAVLLFALNKSREEKLALAASSSSQVDDENQDKGDSAKSDTLGQSKPNSDSQTAQAIPPIDPNKKDTLRFECLERKGSSCLGIKIRGDEKTTFGNRIERIVNHNDTTRITITLPINTGLFINGIRAQYGSYSTLFLYKGKIIHKER
jgi:transcriptional regulator with XRE-family HTH domain